MTVRDAQRRIDSREFSEWQAFEIIEPFGPWRADAQAGIIASVVANTHRTRGKAFTPGDFMMKFDGEKKKPMTAEQQIAMLKTWARAHNAKVKKHGDNRKR